MFLEIQPSQRLILSGSLYISTFWFTYLVASFLFAVDVFTVGYVIVSLVMVLLSSVVVGYTACSEEEREMGVVSVPAVAYALTVLQGLLWLWLSRGGWEPPFGYYFVVYLALSLALLVLILPMSSVGLVVGSDYHGEERGTLGTPVGGTASTFIISTCVVLAFLGAVYSLGAWNRGLLLYPYVGIVGVTVVSRQVLPSDKENTGI